MENNMQTGELNTENNIIETEKEKKQREKAASKYNKYDPWDVLNNPYGQESEYIEDARAIKFAEPKKQEKTSDPNPEWNKTLGERLDFMKKYIRFDKMQSSEVITPEDIEKSGYADLYYYNNYKYDPREMPDDLDKVRYNLNKSDNFKKAIKQFGHDAVDGFVKSVKSLFVWKAFTGGFEGEVDTSSSFENIVMNGYPGIVHDPDKAGKKFTKEYWLQQLASMGTTAGMGVEMLAEGLLLKGLGKLASATKTGRSIKASYNAAETARIASDAKKSFNAEETARTIANAGNVREANRVLENAAINPSKIIANREKQLTKDILTGSAIGVKNATLNYQYNYNDVYSDVINAGGSEIEAKEKAEKAAMNTYQMEIAASIVMNVLQTSVIHSMSNAKFNKMQQNLEAAVSGKNVAMPKIEPLSTKGIFWKNAGKFGLSAIQEGLEEIMEDGLAMIGREQAYLSDWQRWDALGMSYKASDNYSQLFDSFIGGVMGGTVFSGVRVGLNAAMGKSETRLKKKEIELYNTLAEKFNKNLDIISTGIIKKNKEISLLQDDYNNLKDIEFKGKKYSAKKNDGTENPEYKSVFEAKRKQIEQENSKSITLLRTIEQASLAAQMMSIMGDNTSSEFIAQNAQILRERRKELDDVYDINENDVERIFQEAETVENYIDEIANLEGEEKAKKQKEYDDYCQEIADDSENVVKMRKVLDIFGVKGERSFNEESIKKAIDEVESQIYVTNVFNHSFYNYYTGLNDDMDAAIRYATNEAHAVTISLGITNTVDDVLNSMEDIFKSIEKSDSNYFKSSEHEREAKLAFAYNFFKYINRNGRYDFVLQVLMSEMAQKSGGVIQRDEKGALPTNISSLREVINFSNGAYYYDLDYITERFDDLLKKYDVSYFKNMTSFAKLAEERDAVSFWQQIFDKKNEKNNEYAELKRKMSIEDYERFKTYFENADFRSMLDLANEILKDIKSGISRGEKLLIDAVNENFELEENLPKEIEDLTNKKKEAEETSLNTLFEKIDEFSDDKIGQKAQAGATGEDIEKIGRTIRIRDIVKKAVDGDKDILEIFKTDFDQQINDFERRISESDIEYQKKLERYNKVKSLKERLHQLDRFIESNKYFIDSQNESDENIKEDIDKAKAEIEKIISEIFSYYGKFKSPINEKFLNSLPISDEAKKRIWESVQKELDKHEKNKVAKKILNEKLFNAAIETATELVNNISEVEITDKEKQRKESIQNEYNEWKEKYSEYSEAKKHFENIKKQLDDTKNSIQDIENQIKEKKELLDSIEHIDIHYENDVNFRKKIDDLVEAYKPLDIEYSEDKTESVNNNALLNETQFKAFFDIEDNRSANMLYKTMDAASKARNDIEYLNSINKYNHALRSVTGIVMNKFKLRYADIIQMPETTIKGINKKLSMLANIIKDYEAYDKILSDKDSDYIWNNALHEIVLAMKDIEKKKHAIQMNEAIEEEIKLRDAARKENIFIVDVLKSELNSEAYKLLADIEKVDVEHVIMKLNELLEKGKISEDEAKRVISQLQIERMRQDVKNLGKIQETREEEEKGGEDENDKEDKRKEFDFETAEKNTIYYIEGNEEAANKIAKNVNSENVINVSEQGISKFLNTDAKVIFKDENGIVHFYDENCKENTSTVNFNDSKSKVEEKINSKGFNYRGTNLYNKTSTQDENGNISEIPLGWNIIYAVREALQNSNDFDWTSYNGNRTFGKALNEYVAEQLGLENISEANHILSVIRQVCSLGQTEDIYYNRILNAATNDEIFWNFATVYPLAMFQNENSPKTFDEVTEKMYSVALQNNRPFTFGQVVLPTIIQGMQQTSSKESPELKKMRTEHQGNQRTYGIRISENNTHYSGTSGIVAHQRFVQSTKEGEKDVLYPLYVDSKGNSIIQKEAFKKIDENEINGVTTFEIRTGIEKIIEDNLSIYEIDNDGNKIQNVFISNLGREIAEKLESNLKEGNDIFEGLEDKKEYIINQAKQNALIAILEDGLIVGFLPYNGYWELSNIKCDVETISSNGYEQSFFTDKAIENSQKRVEKLNNNLSNIRKQAIEGTVTIKKKMIKDIDTSNGAMINASEEIKDNIVFGKNGVFRKINSDPNIYYYRDRTRPALGIIPGYQNYDENTGKITVISNSNKNQDNFKLSKTAEPVFTHTKVQLLRLAQDIWLNLDKDKRDAIETKFGRIECISKIGNTNVKRSILESFMVFLNSMLINNSSTLKFSENEENGECCKIVLSDSKLQKGSDTFYEQLNKDSEEIIFYFGTPNELNDTKKAIIIKANGEIDTETLIDLFSMILCDNDAKLNEQIDNLQVGYNQILSKSKNDNRGKNQANITIGKNEVIIEGGEYKINEKENTDEEKSFKEWAIDNIKLPIGKFTMYIGKDEKGEDVKIDIGYKRINFESVENENPIEDTRDTDKIKSNVTSENGPTPNDLFNASVEVQKEQDKSNEKLEAVSQLGKDSSTQDTSVSEAVKSKRLTDSIEAENVTFTHTEEWMPSIQDTEEVCKALFRGAINVCLNNKIKLNLITKENLRNAINDILQEQYEKREVYIRYFISSVVQENGKKYDSAEVLSDNIKTRYPYLDKDIIDEYAEMYFENPENYSVITEYNGKKAISNIEFAKNVAIMFSKQYMKVLFDIDTGAFQEFISPYISNSSMYILEEQNPYIDNEVEDNGEVAMRLFSDDNTTPIIDNINKELRMVLATIPYRTAKSTIKIINGKENVVKTGERNNDGTLKTERIDKSRFALSMGLQQCYDLHDIIDFLSQLGREHKGYTWESFKEELQKIASKDGKYMGMASAILERFNKVKDPAVIQQFEYKIDDMQSVNFVQMYEYPKNGTIEVRESSDTQSVKTILRQMERYATNVIITGKSNNIQIVDKDGNFTIDCLKDVKKYSDSVFSKNIIEEFKKTGEMPKQIEEFKNNVEILFERFLGWIPEYEMYEDEKTLTQILEAYNELYDNIDGKKKAMQKASQKSKFKTSNKEVPSYMIFKKNKKLEKLLEYSLEYEIIPEGMVYKRAGKNVQSVTQRTMATKRLYEMKDEKTELGKKANTIITANGRKCKLYAQFENVKKKKYKQGFYDISVYGRTGYMSDKITQMSFNDHLYVNTLIALNSRDKNDVKDTYIVDFLGKSVIWGNTYFSVMPDFTDSNKTKSALWTIPTMSFQCDNMLNENHIEYLNDSRNKNNITSPLYGYINYVRYSLFDNEIRRIWDIIGSSAERINERLIMSNLSYNTIEIEDEKGNIVTLANYFASVDNTNKDSKLSHFKEQYEKISLEANKKTVEIINATLIPLSGVSLKINENNNNDSVYISVEYDRDAMIKSHWNQCGIFKINEKTEKSISISENNITNARADYYSTLLELDAINNITDNLKSQKYAKELIGIAAIDFVCNDIVVKDFLANVIYSNSYDIAEKSIQSIDMSSDKQSLIKGLNKIYKELNANTNKRMAGILTGGNHLDYTGAYTNINENTGEREPIDEYKDWGGINHDKFMYIVVDETKGEISGQFMYLAALHYSGKYDNENMKLPKEKRKSIFEIHKDKFMNPKENEKWIKKNCPEIYGFMNINSTDGQEFCSWREIVDTLSAQGDITPEYRDELRRVYTKMSNGESLTEEEKDFARESLQVFKPVYCGVNNITDSNGNSRINSMDYVKSSVAPLLPQFTADNPFLDNIRKSIEELEKSKKMNVHLAFRSAVKTGGFNKIKRDTQKDINIEQVSQNAGTNIQELDNASFVADRKYYSIQNETKTKIHSHTEKKNKNLNVLIKNINIGKIEENGNTKIEERKYNIQYTLETLSKDLNLDFTNKYIRNVFIESCVTICDIKNKNQSIKFLQAVLDNSKDNSTVINTLSSFVYEKGKIYITYNQLEKIYDKLKQNILFGIAYNICSEENLLDSEKSHEYNLEIHVNKYNELSKLNDKEKADLFKKYGYYNSTSEKSLYMTSDEFKQYIEYFDTNYETNAKISDDFIDEYMNVVENPESVTVELTQFQHMVTANGISKIHDNIFEIDFNRVFTEDIEKYLAANGGIENFVEKKGNKYLINGINIERLRTAFEIVENTKEVLKMMHDDLAIISDSEYAIALKNMTIPKIKGEFQNDSENMKRIIKIIERELIARGTNTNAIDMLKARIPLMLNSELLRIENLLMSIVKKRVSRSYLNGSSFFLMTPYGFSQTKETKLKVEPDKSKEFDLVKDNGVIWIDSERKPGPLRATFVEGEKLSMAECAISPQFTYYDKEKQKYKVVNLREEVIINGKKQYKYLEEKEGHLFLKKDMLDRNLLEMVSLRVPTSGLMNTCALKIVAFLPESMGGTIIVPKEHVAQFGEDFDIDKRFCYTKSYHVNENGSIVEMDNNILENFKSIFGSFQNKKQYNDIVESMENGIKSNIKTSIYLSILKCKDPKVQKNINITLNWEKLKETKQQILNLSENENEEYIAGHGNILNQIDLCVKNSTAAIGVGTWANTTTYNNIISRVNVPSGKYDENGKMKYEGVIMNNNGKRLNIKIDGKGKDALLFNGNLSSPMTISKDIARTKIEVLSAQLNICLDTVKEDIIAYINENTQTLPFFTAMALMGFDTGKKVKFYKAINGTFDISDKKVEEGTFDLATFIAIQPVIKHLVLLEQNRNSIRGNSFKKNIDLIKETLLAIGFTNEDIEKMDGSNNPDEELSKFKISENGVIEIVANDTSDENGEYSVLDYGDITSQDLYQMSIRKTDDLSDSQKKLQLKILSFFTTVRAKGWQLQKYRTLINTNSTGIGSIFLDTRSHIKKLNDLGKSDDTLKNMKWIIGDFIEKKDSICPEGYYDIEGCDYYIKPTTSEGANLLMSLQSSNIILGNSLGYMSEGINEIFDYLDTIYDENELYQKERKHYEGRSVRDLQNYILLLTATENGNIFQKYGNLPKDKIIFFERLRLIKGDYDDFIENETKTVPDKDKAAKKKKIIDKLKEFNVDDTFHKQYSALKTSNEYKNTPLFRCLNTMTDNTFIFRIEANDGYEVRRIQNQLSEWYYKPKEIEVNGTKINTRKFVIDLIALSFVMDDKQGINSFRNIIPVDVIKDLRLDTTLRNVMRKIKNGEYIDNFKEWFIVNNQRVAVTTRNNNAKFSLELKNGIKRKIIRFNGNTDDLRKKFEQMGIRLPKEGKAYPEMFIYKNKKENILFVYNKNESNDKQIVYYVKNIKDREDSGRNYYNPYISPGDFFTDNIDRTFETTQIKKTDAARINELSSSSNPIDKIASYLSSENDPMLTLLRKMYETKKFGDIEIEVVETNDDEFYNFRVVTDKQKNKFTLLCNMKNINSLRKQNNNIDFVVREEIMHMLIWNYLEANIGYNENTKQFVIKNNVHNKKLKNTLAHFQAIKKYYTENRNKYSESEKTQLDNILRNNNNWLNLNEFISNIMSANPDLIKVVQDYENENNIENKEYGIISSIIDFIIDLFNEICKISKIHNDVAREVNDILYNLYLDNNSQNIAPDILETMSLFNDNIPKINYGKNIVESLSSYKAKKYKDSEKINVTELSSGEKKDFSKMNKNDIKNYGYQRNHFGTFIDAALRIVLDPNLTDKQIITKLQNFENPVFYDDKGNVVKYKSVLMRFDQNTINMLLNIRNEIKRNGGVEKIYNQEIYFSSDFQVYTKEGYKYIAGKPDFIIIDKSGMVTIIDLKTHMRNKEKENDIVMSDSNNMMIHDYTRQVAWYRKLISDVTGVDTDNIRCEILEIDYDPDINSEKRGNMKTSMFDISDFIDNVVYFFENESENGKIVKMNYSEKATDYIQNIKLEYEFDSISKKFC